MWPVYTLDTDTEGQTGGEGGRERALPLSRALLAPPLSVTFTAGNYGYWYWHCGTGGRNSYVLVPYTNRDAPDDVCALRARALSTTLHIHSSTQIDKIMLWQSVPDLSCGATLASRRRALGCDVSDSIRAPKHVHTRIHREWSTRDPPTTRRPCRWGMPLSWPPVCSHWDDVNTPHAQRHTAPAAPPTTHIESVHWSAQPLSRAGFRARRATTPSTK